MLRKWLRDNPSVRFDEGAAAARDPRPWQPRFCALLPPSMRAGAAVCGSVPLILRANSSAGQSIRFTPGAVGHSPIHQCRRNSPKRQRCARLPPRSGGTFQRLDQTFRPNGPSQKPGMAVKYIHSCARPLCGNRYCYSFTRTSACRLCTSQGRDLLRAGQTGRSKRKCLLRIVPLLPVPIQNSA
jgi:hypothetical protein